MISKEEADSLGWKLSGYGKGPDVYIHRNFNKHEDGFYMEMRIVKTEVVIVEVSAHRSFLSNNSGVKFDGDLDTIDDLRWVMSRIMEGDLLLTKEQLATKQNTRFEKEAEEIDMEIEVKMCEQSEHEKEQLRLYNETFMSRLRHEPEDFEYLTMGITITDKITIVDEAKGKIQEDVIPSFTTVFVEQWASGTEDHFNGFIYAELKDGTYIKIPYEC